LTQLKDLEKDLKRELEEGSYFLHREPVFEKIQKVLQLRRGTAKWEASLDELLLELLAGLSVFDRAAYAAKFEELIRDQNFSKPAKVKALHMIRQHLMDPEHSAACLALYRFFLEAPDDHLRDFAARSILQLMTEMRVGGQMDLILAENLNRKKITGILKNLSGQGWLEAAELLDLLELAS